MGYKYLKLITDLAQDGKIRLCVIGQDPYEWPKACGIAFCPNTFEQLLDGYTCGKEVLVSLGYGDFDAIQNNFSNPISFFYYLAEYEGIAFVNLSDTIGALQYGPEYYESNRGIIQENLTQTRTVIVCADNAVLLGRSYASIVNSELGIDAPDVIIHPSGLARSHQDYEDYWGDDACYLKNTYSL